MVGVLLPRCPLERHLDAAIFALALARVPLVHRLLKPERRSDGPPKTLPAIRLRHLARNEVFDWPVLPIVVPLHVVAFRARHAARDPAANLLVKAPERLELAARGAGLGDLHANAPVWRQRDDRLQRHFILFGTSNKNLSIAFNEEHEEHENTASQMSSSRKAIRQAQCESDPRNHWFSNENDGSGPNSGLCVRNYATTQNRRYKKLCRDAGLSVSDNVSGGGGARVKKTPTKAFGCGYNGKTKRCSKTDEPGKVDEQCERGATKCTVKKKSTDEELDSMFDKDTMPKKKQKSATKKKKKKSSTKKKKSEPKKAAAKASETPKTGVAEKKARELRAAELAEEYKKARAASKAASKAANDEAKAMLKKKREQMIEAKKEAKQPVKHLKEPKYKVPALKKDVAKMMDDSTLVQKLDQLAQNGAKQDIVAHDAALHHLIKTAQRKLSGSRRRSGKTKSKGKKRTKKKSSSGKRKLSKCTKGRVRRSKSPRRCVKRSTLAKESARKRKRKNSR